VIVIAINGTQTAAGAAGPQVFEYEVWENLEFLGRDVVGKTNNSLDAVGTQEVVGDAKKTQSQSDPLNPTTGKDILRKVFASKSGGTVVGNTLQSFVSSLNPAAGAIWAAGRSALNSSLSRSSRRSRLN